MHNKRNKGKFHLSEMKPKHRAPQKAPADPKDIEMENCENDTHRRVTRSGMEGPPMEAAKPWKPKVVISMAFMGYPLQLIILIVHYIGIYFHHHGPPQK